MSRSVVAVRHVLFEDLGIVALLLTERGGPGSSELGLSPFFLDELRANDDDRIVTPVEPI